LIPLEPKVDREYDPLWPNEYEKVVLEIKASLKRKDDESANEKDDEYPGGKRPYIARNQLLARQRFDQFSDRNPSGFSGFGGQPSMIDDEELPFQPTEKDREERSNRSGGIAIAPPPSLMESSASPPPAVAGGGGAGGLTAPTGMNFAQKLMAKYGYKEGSGLGKNKQGLTKALQVEKTSRRGGIIINEDMDPAKAGAAVPPPANLYGLGSLVGDYGDDDNENEDAAGEDKNGGDGNAGDEYGSTTPPAGVGQESEESAAFQGFKQPGAPDDDGFKVPVLPFGNDPFKVPLLPGGGMGMPAPGGGMGMPAPPPPKTSVTELIKNPTRVVLMKNMVGPGEVDDELEPEVKEECETKYGEIASVKILEKSNVADHETVQIYLEFKRIECAIKALVDLNGRFFGGREVHAAFFNEAQYLAGNL